MTTRITRTWFDGGKVVTQEIPESEVYKQEPVAWAVFEGWNAHDLYLPQEYDEALKMAGYKGDHAQVKPLYTTPPQRKPLTDERVDAQRYRLLRRGQHWSVINGIGDVLSADALDAEIDKAAHGIKENNT
jgi:hypothetical protein